MSREVTIATNKFKQITEELTGKFVEAAEAGGKVLVTAMSQRAPKRTGKLSRGIVMSTERTEGGVSVKVGPGKDVFYGGRWIELGTKFMPAQPYMRPAMDESKKQVLAAVKEAIKK